MSAEPTPLVRLTDTEFDRHIQKLAEDHLTACGEALMAEGEGEEVESPAFAPFCGCETCVVREVLTVVWNEMWERARHEAGKGGQR